nr:PREDICTED: zinc finger protein 407-like [Paralichthys olivaceus]
MEESKRHSPSRNADSVPEDGDNLCTACGFSAKCPRSLKIHFARRHGNNSKNSDNTAKPTVKSDNISDVSQAEKQLEADMETESAVEESDLLELRSAANDNGKSLTKKQRAVDKQQADQGEVILTQERRVSKRTPKPKMIYSCNYCGQEFRDKAPLDVHIQRYHTKGTPYTFDADENMDDEEEPEDPADPVKATEIRVATKHAHSRFLLKCEHCDFRLSTPALLENHARHKHLDQEWYRCKLCNYFSATPEWMEAHLSSDNHMQLQAVKQNAESSSFHVYVECVKRDHVGDAANIDDCAQPGGMLKEGHQETEKAVEAAQAVLVDDLELEPPRKKRGRPKQGSTTTCGYCGLVVSNATNLSVHVRRKHSKEYGYSCTLCNYNCVTKGDMDRHCITKKHVRRAQECSKKNPVYNPTSASQQESTSSQAQQPNAASHTSDKEQESNNTENSGQEPTQSDSSQRKSKYDFVNACSDCDFVAHSLPSLQLHVKRKHTKEFEYVCLACSYYSVTSREMSRHANTEKHKLNSQRYLEPVGSEGRRALALPLKPRDVIELSGLNSNTEESESCSNDSRATESQNTAVTSIATEPVHTVVIVAGSADEKQRENIASSTGAESDPTNKTVALTAPSEAQETPADLQPAADESAQQESQEEGAKEEDNEHENADVMSVDEKSDSSHSDTQVPKALFLDACIVSMKALAEQEQVLQEDLALEGEAAVICLTGGTPVLSDHSTPSYAYVKTLKPKEMKVKEKVKASGSRIRCEDCGFIAEGISGLNVHISMKHPSKERHFHCLVCGKSFYTESNLHQHLTSASHLRNEQNSVEELPEGGASFKCVKCTDRFESEQDLFVHIKEKHEELLREVNKYVVEDTEQINREREENKGCVCKYCGKVCKSSNSMAFLAHIRTHTGSKPFMCKICNFATAQLGDARNHVKRHLGMREYKCDICGWAFVMKKHLSTHLLGKHGVGQPKESSMLTMLPRDC